MRILISFILLCLFILPSYADSKDSQCIFMKTEAEHVMYFLQYFESKNLEPMYLTPIKAYYTSKAMNEPIHERDEDKDIAIKKFADKSYEDCVNGKE